MVGSRPQIEAGQLRLLVGGDPAALAGLRPVLEIVAGRVDHVGPVGHAAVLKLVVNGPPHHPEGETLLSTRSTRSSMRASSGARPWMHTV